MRKLIDTLDFIKVKPSDQMEHTSTWDKLVKSRFNFLNK